MIKITIPNNNIKERKYVIEILFGEFLSLAYKIEVKEDIENYEIILPNQNKMTFKDAFFKNFPEKLSYLKKGNIPSKIKFTQNQFIPEDNIPIIYGDSMFGINTDKKNLKIIYCGIDIFASCFFMLTRWEEYVNKSRDCYNRFAAIESLAYKNGFLSRPIVNEYVEMLKKMFFYLDNTLKFKEQKFQLFLTHDVDALLKYTNFKSGLGEIAGDIIKRKDIKQAVLNIFRQYRVYVGLQKDPFDSFDWMMNKSERFGLKSRFYFMSGGTSESKDNRYRIEEAKGIFDSIVKRGHLVGFHGSYNSYNDLEQFKNEKERLEKSFDIVVAEGRQHYLRFEVPTTWQIWEDAGMLVDSTCGYADREGFRCGTGDEFSVFNVLSRKKLNLKERPLVVMEGSFITYQPNIKPTEMEEKIKYLLNQAKKYNGDFVLLWHNSSFNTSQWRKYQDIYERVLLKNENLNHPRGKTTVYKSRECEPRDC